MSLVIIEEVPVDNNHARHDRDEVAPSRSSRYPPNPFLRSLPGATEWREKQLQTGLVTVEKYEKIVEDFIRCDSTTSDTTDLISIGISFAKLTKTYLNDRTIQRQLPYYRTLLLLLYCDVLDGLHYAPEKIDLILQHAFNCREKERRKIRRPARKIYGLIPKLVERGWSIYRANELFVISESSCSLYG